MLCYNINHVLNRQKNKSAEPIATVPNKDILLVSPFLGCQSEALARRAKSCVSKFYGYVNLRVIFNCDNKFLGRSSSLFLYNLPEGNSLAATEFVRLLEVSGSATAK